MFLAVSSTISPANELNALYSQLDQAKRAKNWNRVVEIAQTILERHSTSGRAWYRLGVAKENLEDFAVAERAFKRAADLDYDRLTSLMEAAQLAAKEGNKDRAFGYLQQLAASGFDQPAQVEANAGLSTLKNDPRLSQIVSAVKNNVKWQSANPRWSKDGKKIIFDRSLSEFPPSDSQIFSINPDGSHETQLTFGQGIGMMPDFSPDGRQIVYSSGDGGTRKLRVEDLQTHHSRVLVKESVGNEHFPSWSFDGSQIVFNADANGHRQIYIVNLDGSGLAALTSADFHSDYARWMAKGAKISFESDRAGMWDTCEMDRTGAGQRPIAWGSTPDFSPNSRRVVFDNMLITGIGQIYIMQADGSQVRKISNGHAELWEPSWSPDGKQIVFMSRATGRFEVWVMNADGSNVRRLTDSSSGIARMPQ